MKILQLIQKQQLRGAEIFACQLGRQLLHEGHEVRIICLQEGAADLPFEGTLINLKRPPSARLLDASGWRQLAREIQGFQPDIVQANAGDTLKYAVWSKLLFRWKAPIVFRNASTMSQYIKSGLAIKWNAFLLRQVQAVISVSDKSKADVIGLFPFLQNKVYQIPVGIDLKELTPAASSLPPYLLHVGGFTFEKNHGRLLHIFKGLAAEFPDLELWLAGDGPLRPAVEEQAHHMGLSSKIRFLGFQPEVLPLMQNAKALVLPSIIEGLPGVILEAMYCRTPVIANNVGGISEVVKTGETGWLVNPGDEEGFVKAIKEAIQKEEHTMVLENAYQKVVSDYDNQKIAHRFIKIYSAVLQNPV